MVFISEELVRKRAEHNNYEISTLEELSLHQQDIEAITNLDKWCKELKILYLQSNLISRIENVGKLKKLEYLNLALNNITEIENLGNCESLKKLDLTVNFVSELTTIESLKNNSHFSELYLTGNPCTEYEGYREYVIATLPQLKQLDGKEIDRSERILAVQQYSALRDSILLQQELYRNNQQKQENLSKGKTDTDEKDSRPCTDTSTDYRNKEACSPKSENFEEMCKEDREKLYWSEVTKYTPETRIEMHNHISENKKTNHKQDEGNDSNLSMKQIKYFKDNGDPLNINNARINFTFTEEEESGVYLLDVHCYKHLDTSLIDVDVQPNFVRVSIKEKILQLVLSECVSPDRSIAQRSKTTGHLLIRMPKAAELITTKSKKSKFRPDCAKLSHQDEVFTSTSTDIKRLESVRNDSAISLSDIANIVREDLPTRSKQEVNYKDVSEAQALHFIDDPEVPPLV